VARKYREFSVLFHGFLPFVPGRKTGAVTPAVIVGVFGILVAFLVVAALVHIRARGGADEHFLDEEAPSDVPEVNEEDLDWDDSAMTITVNPFEVTFCERTRRVMLAQISVFNANVIESSVKAKIPVSVVMASMVNLRGAEDDVSLRDEVFL